MKRILTFIFVLVVIFNLPSCTDTTQSTGDFKSAYADKYEYYSESVSELKTSMKLTDKQTDAVFGVLSSCGASGKISNCFENTDKKGVAYYKVWSDLEHYNVYLKNGAVDKVFHNDDVIYENGKKVTQNSSTTQSVTTNQQTSQGVSSTVKPVSTNVAKTNSSKAKTTSKVNTTEKSKTTVKAKTTAKAKTTKQKTTKNNQPIKYTLILNNSTKVYHLSDGCRAVKRIKAENREERYCTINEITAEGYSACGICAKGYK